MPAGIFTLYAKNKDDLRINDLASANLRLALITSAYTPNVAVAGHSLFSEVSASQIGSTNTGYSAGGIALTGTVAATDGNNGYKLSTGNTVWTAGSAGLPAWRYGVLYYLGTLWGMTNPLIGYFNGDSTLIDVPATGAGNKLTVNCPTTGWFDLI